VENKTATSKIETAYGKTLPEALEYEYSWKEFSTDEELVEAKQELTLEEQRKVRNVEALSNARQKALKKRLDDAGIVKPTAENDDQVRLKDMFKTLKTAKNTDGSPIYTDEQARDIAATTLRLTWAS
jgi:hypothetical protein